MTRPWTLRWLVGRVLLYAAVALFVVATLLPVLWMLIVSVAPPADLTAKPLRFIPSTIDWGNYVRLLTFTPNSPGAAFLAALRNSLTVALVGTAISLAVAIPAAWCFSRSRGRYDALLYGVLSTYMMPAVALLLPLYFLLATLGLLNSVTGLIIVYCSVLTPFVTWFAKSAIDAVPEEIESAAQIDGAGFFQLLRHVTLPLARAGIATAALFAILLAWDEFFYALLFTATADAKTLTVTIADFAGGRATDFGLVAAAGLLTALPPVLIAFVLQKALVSGLTAGSVKG
ncbi:carbohydrate ABC transporter permease [Labrys wisconsinensis]|uniref:Maltose/maltodextrin transport system permease protein MalG n=1 Tax=Labrys wisconsinensis TaxID=425677 RepID=A0ABU0J5Y4_9HYPH|nr:carbohydrate ABC transporter permease [Labrys wisconsinensis]MDQ0469668.1 multiple sugar transport system permease protein [Labrys wisconsinensis]